MPTAREHLDVAQQRHDLFHVGDLLGCARKGYDHVVITRDVERRHRDLRPVERRHQLPIAIDVAIVVEGTAKTTVRKFSRVDIQVGFAEP